MYRDYPDYRRGTLDKGFVLLSIIPIDFTHLALAGGVDYYNLSVPPIGRFDELLSLFILTDQIPVAAPEALVISFILGFWRRGLVRALVLGDSALTYELDLSAARLMAYRTNGVNQRIDVKLTAHAVNNTNFYVKGMLARYTFAT